MRLIFLLLLLGNLVFFVWSQGYFGGRSEGREPQRLHDQLQPERMKVSQAPPTTVPPPVAAAPEAPAPACRRVDGLLAKDLERLQPALQGAGFTVSVVPVEAAPSYWVNIPALPNGAAAEKKASELKLFGVTEFQVMPAEGGGYAISLGVFRNEAGANEFLQGLNKRGVKSARIDTQTKAPVQTRINVRGATDELARRLPELLAGTAGVTTADCP